MSSPNTEMVKRLRAAEEQLSTGPEASSSLSSSSSSSLNALNNTKDNSNTITMPVPKDPRYESIAKFIPALPLWGIIFDYLDLFTKSELIKEPIFAEDPNFQYKWLHTQLMNHVVRGEEDAAVAISNETPKLLLKEGDVIDYSGFHFQGTPMRALFWAQDMDMAKKMVPCFDKLKGGRREMEKQYHEHFTKESEEQDALQIEEGKKAIEKVFATIKNAPPNNEHEAKEEKALRIANAVNEFKDFLKPKAVIKTGTNIITALYAYVLQLYFNNYSSFGSHWNDPQHLIVRNEVIGTLERYVPACIAQAMPDLYEIVCGQQTLKRSFNLGDGLFWYPLDANPHFILGDNNSVVAVERALGRRDLDVALRDVNKLYETKTAERRSFLSPSQQLSRPSPSK